ncbi:neuronal acetylcholine receptor subunit alpha-6-like [Saccoglossus kowalevskii]
MTCLKFYVITCGLLAYLASGIYGSSEAEQKEMETQSKLFTKLFHKYHKHVAPVRIHPEHQKKMAINVSVNIALQSIVNMDIHSGLLETQIWMMIEWVDHRLSWNSSYNVDSLHIHPDEIWRPDLALFDSEMMEEHPVKYPLIMPSGKVYWVPTYKAFAACGKSTWYFPNDKHTCSYKLGSWSYDESYLDLRSNGDKLMTYYKEHTDWKVLGESIERHAKKYACCNETYVDVTFTLTIQRVTSFYSAILVTPAVLITLALILVFGLPPDCRQKIDIIIGVLIISVVLQFHLATVVSEATALGGFLLFSTIADLLILAETVLVYNLFHRNTRTHPIPECLRSVCMSVLPRIICLTKPRARKYDVTLNTNENDGDERDIKILESSQKAEDVDEEWRFIARVLDRISFCIFLIFYVLVTACILVQPS